MHAQQSYSSLSVCMSVFLYVCKRSNYSSLPSKCDTTRIGTILRECYSLMDYAKMASFKSYAVIYLAICVAIYEVLFVFCSYPNDDTETVTFDRNVLAVLTTVVLVL